MEASGNVLGVDGADGDSCRRPADIRAAAAIWSQAAITIMHLRTAIFGDIELLPSIRHERLIWSGPAALLFSHDCASAQLPTWV